MGRGPGRPAKTRWPQQYTTYHGPRPGPAHENTWPASWAGRHGPYRAHISWAAARPVSFSSHGPRLGPAHQFFIAWAAARPGPSNFHRMGLGPARPIRFSNFHGPAWPFIFSSHGPRPGPVHHNFKFLGPARPITIFLSARPCPDHRPMASPGIFCQKEVYRDSKRYIGIPLLVLLCLQ